jgi:hypothetical protein
MSKNIQKVQDMLDGNYKSKIQVGQYTGNDEQREIGDKWVDSEGYHWEQREGFRVKSGGGSVSKGLGDNCSNEECGKLIVHKWDKDTYKADGRCYHCQLNYELDLKFDKPIRWFAYRRLRDFRNQTSLEKEMEQWVEEFTKMRNEQVFDKKVANAIANGEVELTINKNKTMS